ncbi:MAG: hypothetical protein M3067_11440 [Chloroflexota bacterium]|nr:hypothetical protein [Chloroflexota bacterium]
MRGGATPMSQVAAPVLCEAVRTAPTSSDPSCIKKGIAVLQFTIGAPERFTPGKLQQIATSIAKAAAGHM